MSERDRNPNADLASLYGRKSPLTVDQSMGLDVFNNAVKAIHGQRQGKVDAHAERRALLDAEWEKVVTACRTLKQRLEGHAKIQAFSISERGKTVQVALRTDPGKPPYMITLARDHYHPEQNRIAPALWLFRPGNESHQYDSAAELVRQLATALASWTA